jgi:hypothetical protein
VVILRFLLLFGLLYLFFTLLNLYLFRRKRAPSPRRGGGATQAEEEEMVLDPQCKSYLPKSTAILRGEEYFCSDECARLYLTGRST